MKLIDADALRENMRMRLRCTTNRDLPGIDIAMRIVDAAPSIDCAADNPHGLVPSKCPTCGEGLVPCPCLDMAQDSYRDGILYGQEHPEWGANG